MARTALEWVNLAVAAMFLASAVLQYNDPDPLPWMLVYGGGGVACLVARPGRVGQGLPVVVGTVSLVWALWLLPEVIPEFRFGDLFLAMKAETPAIELGREALGLLMIAAWMIVLLVSRCARPSAPA